MITIDPEKISKSRTEIMGIAMLLVMLFHTSIVVDDLPILSFLKEIGDIGVDIFLMMSGFGIAHSLRKSGSDIDFYKKRCVRIIPTYLLVAVPWFLFIDIVLNSLNGIGQCLLDISMFSFWLNGKLTGWYISSLLVLYFLSPIYMRVREKGVSVFFLSTAISYIFSILLRVFPFFSPLSHIMIFTFRIPAYLVGIEIAILHRNEKIVRLKGILGIFLIGGALLVCMITTGYLTFWYIPWAFKYITYLPLSLLVVLFGSNLARFKPLQFLGKNSLEIYLLHEKVLWLLTNVAIKLSIDLDRVDYRLLGLNSIAVVCSLVLAIALKWCVNQGKHYRRRK